jgi:hypothetical protein
MSDLRIALVAEGPTDAILVEAALKAVLTQSFVLTLLQPEPTRPLLGTGWCGVFKWCREFASRGSLNLESDALLQDFDLIILHIDADVADMSYADGGAWMEREALTLPALPCSQPCPPPHAAVDEIRRRVVAWLGIAERGWKTVLCVPSKAIESWLAAGVLGQTHPLLNGLECKLNVDEQLAQLPKAYRIHKRARVYRTYAPRLVAAWAQVRHRCGQAEQFSVDVAQACEMQLAYRIMTNRPT